LKNTFEDLNKNMKKRNKEIRTELAGSRERTGRDFW
jgi:hypothetical protein